jgi:GT2 family glycosyltransferase
MSILPRGYSLDVFLVDDGSSDGTAYAVKQNFPQVNIITGNGQLFWNRGMHMAWQLAIQLYDYDYYLWLNDDTYIFQTALNELLLASDLNENKAIIVAATCSKVTGKTTYSGVNLKSGLIHPEDKLVQVDTFNGNFVLIPKFVYKVVGNLDDFFHHSIGDYDYGLRAKRQNIKSYLAPGFLAYCESHDQMPKWCIPSIPFKQRLFSLYSPLGHCHPYHFFRYELRHFGLIVAVKHFFSIHLRLFFPTLWKN